jgi:hypothetical protein
MYNVLEARKVEFVIGSSLDQAFAQLKDREQLWNCKTYGSFNGAMLFCDDTLDEVYVKVCGNIKSEVDRENAEWQRKYEEEERLHKEKIPQLIDEYIEKARGIICEDKLEEWKK